MEDNHMALDCTKQEQIQFTKKFKILLWVAIILTIFTGLVGIMWLHPTTVKEFVEKEGVTPFVNRELIYISMCFLGIAFIKILTSKRPFSGILIGCFYSIGLLYVTASVVVQFIPGYDVDASHFVMMSSQRFVIEGILCLVGIILLLFGRIMKYGFEYQKEIDSTI